MPRSPLFLMGLAVLLGAGAAAATLRAAAGDAIVVDGQRDPAYALLAEDTPGDLDPALSGDPESRYRWADLTRLYVAHDDQNLYVFVDLPDYDPFESSGQFGLAIMTRPVVSASDSLADLWGLPITISYSLLSSGTCAPEPTAPQPPDVLIRGHLIRLSDDLPNPNNGKADLLRWDGFAWQGQAAPWRVASLGDGQAGLAFAAGSGIEMSIAFTETGGITTATPLRLQFFTSARGSLLGDKVGAFDTIPPDSQVSNAQTSTLLQVMADYRPPPDAPNSVGFGCGGFWAGEGDGSVPVTVTLGSALSQTVTVTYTASAGSAGDEDFVAKSGTLTFAAGETRAVFEVTVLEDSLDEDDETVLLGLEAPPGVMLGARAAAVLTILDNDAAVWYHVYLPSVRCEGGED